MESPARPVIVGTAGHIDHGKSALIERLTGIHTDRLPEERKRGISIELGFAFLDLPGGVRVGIVDVPGHERFIRQMLAGAGGMDVVVLVIAADEGVMPQTREHLEIVRLLEIPDGFVALTKCDLAESDEWLDVVESEVLDLVAGTPFEGRPIVRCSAKTGEGVDAVRAEIAAAVARAERRARGRETRLPVDRVFTMQGFGTVVTGTLWAGELGVGDAVRVLPEGIDTRIKSVQVHERETDRASAGQRVAVSLHRVEKSRLSRGDWVVRSDVLAPSSMMDAWFRLLPGVSRPMGNRTRVRLHLGASELLARIVLLDRDELRPGDRAPVQLRLEKPGVAERGDRYVVRAYSPMVTIGGGTIVVPHARKRKRGAAGGAVAEAFRRVEAGTPLDRLVETLAGKGLAGESPKALRQETGLSAAELGELAREGRETGVLAGEGRIFAGRVLETAVGLVGGALDAYQEAHPYRWGAPLGELKSGLSREMNPALFDLARERLVASGEASVRGEEIARVGRDPSVEAEGRERAKRLYAFVHDAGFAPPVVPRALEAADDPHAADLLARLLSEKDLVEVSPELAYSAARLEEMRARLRGHFEANGTLAVAEAKALLDDVTRKYIVPLLEYADRVGWTRREGDGRVRGGAL